MGHGSCPREGPVRMTKPPTGSPFPPMAGSLAATDIAVCTPPAPPVSGQQWPVTGYLNAGCVAVVPMAISVSMAWCRLPTRTD
jgi:hypothetical protein